VGIAAADGDTGERRDDDVVVCYVKSLKQYHEYVDDYFESFILYSESTDITGPRE